MSNPIEQQWQSEAQALYEMLLNDYPDVLAALPTGNYISLLDFYFNRLSDGQRKEWDSAESQCLDSKHSGATAGVVFALLIRLHRS
jgi:hypothetical protein